MSPAALLALTAELTDAGALMTAAADALRTCVGGGPVFLACADPATGLFASAVTVDIPDEARDGFFANEMSGRDVLGFLSLHREAGERPFRASDVARLGRLMPALTVALRRAALPPPGPGDRLTFG